VFGCQFHAMDRDGVIFGVCFEQDSWPCGIVVVIDCNVWSTTKSLGSCMEGRCTGMTSARWRERNQMRGWLSLRLLPQH
jgi:hypothetical protein